MRRTSGDPAAALSEGVGPRISGRLVLGGMAGVALAGLGFLARGTPWPQPRQQDADLRSIADTAPASSGPGAEAGGGVPAPDSRSDAVEPAGVPDRAGGGLERGAPAVPVPGQGEGGAGGTYRPTEAERAVAFGLLLDAPVPGAVLDEAIALAEALRRRYGIDTGDLQADRQEAATRAMREVVEPLRFSGQQVEAAARDLGYSLDPASCANFCDNVRRLAEIELQRRALVAFARGAGP